MENSRTIFLAGVVLVLAAVAAYRSSLDAPFLFDDTPAIVANESIRHLWPPGPALSPPADGSGVSGRPLVNLSLAVNYAFGRLTVRGYHVMNLTLHLLATLVLWGVLRRTWRRLRPDEAELPAWSSTLLWTVHPLLTESVTCVVQRNEVMGGLFYLLTLYCFIRSTADGAAVRRWSVLAVVACLLGMASKEIVATAPLVVLLYDRTFVAGTFREAWGRRKIFYGALAATWLPLAWLMGHTAQRAGTVGFGLGVSPWEYLLTQCRALTLYLQLSFWPHPLVLDYGTAIVRHVGDVWAQGLLIVTLLAATAVALRRRPVLGFAGACFFVILAPSSSFVPLVTQTIAEHRMYLPLAAVIVLVVAGLQFLVGRGTAGLCVGLAVALGLGTADRNADYRDALTVWSDALARFPGNPRAQSGVGTAYYKRGDYAEAARHFELSLQLGPGSALTHYNLGLTLDQMGRREEAMANYREAVRLVPTLAPAQAELGRLLLKLGRPQEALPHLRIALAGAPAMVEALNSLGSALAATGNIPEATATYERALAIEPDSADVHFNFGLLLVSLGRVPEAMGHYTEAVRLDKTSAEARLNLGILLAQSGRLAEALAQLRDAVRLKPGLAEAQMNLGLALALADRSGEAVACYEEALRLRPDYAVAHYNLGNALVQLRRWPEAKQHFAAAVRLTPDFAAAREMLEKLQAAPDGP